jgi:hypothetical protein
MATIDVGIPPQFTASFGSDRGANRDTEPTKWVEQMQMIQQGYTGMSLLVDINRDRLFTIGTVLLALAAGSWIGSLLH